MSARHHPRRDVTGDEVLTERAMRLGQVRDVVVLVGSNGGGRLRDRNGIRRDRLHAAAHPLAMSGSALVVPEATKEFVENDLVGLGPTVDEFRSRLGIR
jgi:hypothetical protein